MECNGQKTTCNDLVTAKKCFVTVTNCDITQLSVINHYKLLYGDLAFKSA